MPAPHRDSYSKRYWAAWPDTDTAAARTRATARLSLGLARSHQLCGPSRTSLPRHRDTGGLLGRHGNR